MTKQNKLETLIKLLGDEQKYAEAVKILDESQAASSGNPALGSLALGIGLILLGLALNPTALSALQKRISGIVQERDRIEQVPTDGLDYPPLPPRF